MTSSPPAQGELDAGALRVAEATAWRDFSQMADFWSTRRAVEVAAASAVISYLSHLPPPAPAGVSREEQLVAARTIGCLASKWTVLHSSPSDIWVDLLPVLARLHPAPQLAAVEAERDRLRRLLSRLHRWFQTSAPKHYTGCGLWIDVENALASGPTGDAGDVD